MSDISMTNFNKNNETKIILKLVRLLFKNCNDKKIYKRNLSFYKY